MGDGNERTDTGRENDVGVSRRGFLASSSVLFSQGQLSGSDSSLDRRAPIALQDLTLGRDDLIAPEQNTYTELTVDLDDASLIQFLRDTVVGFEEKVGIAIGFMARQDHDTVPMYIESAAFKVDGDVMQDLFEGIATWVQITYTSNDVVKFIDVKQGTDITRWNVVTHDDWLDTIRIEHVGSVVSFISVYGDLTTKVDPLTAVEYYTELMQKQATGQ